MTRQRTGFLLAGVSSWEQSSEALGPVISLQTDSEEAPARVRRLELWSYTLAAFQPDGIQVLSAIVGPELGHSLTFTASLS